MLPSNIFWIRPEIFVEFEDHTKISMFDANYLRRADLHGVNAPIHFQNARDYT